MDSVRRRRRLARVGGAHQEQHPGEDVNENRPREADADVGGRPGPALHRVTVSGSATSPTSPSDVTLISAFKGSSPCPRRPPPPTKPAIYSLPSRAMVPMISWAKPSSSPANSPRRFTNRL